MDTRSSEAEPTAPSGIGEVALRPRNVRFDFTGSPLRWIPGEPVVSHFISSLNLLLPVGERMFVEAFTEALPYVRDEKVREAMVGFIGQEAIHAATHDRALWEYLDQHDVDPRPFVAQADYVFERIGELTARGPRTLRYRVLVEKLAVIAGIEHFTAVLGDWVLNHPLENFAADPTILDLFRWHGAEEVEHRNVAFDVALYFGVSRRHLVVHFILGSVVLLAMMFRATRFVAHQDPTLPRYGYLSLFREVNNGMQRGALIPWRALWGAFKAYLRPDFTPESLGDTAQAVAYLAQSPAAKAAEAT